jgi:hypothetical protein
MARVFLARFACIAGFAKALQIVWVVAAAVPARQDVVGDEAIGGTAADALPAITRDHELAQRAMARAFARL